MQLKDKICIELMSFIRIKPNEVVIPNYYFGFYEMDVFRLTPSGYVTEYEIKTSRADFKNDFKKSRNVSFSNKIGDNTEVFKHEEIEKGSHKTNKFFFVVPKGLVKADEVPKNCGLIYYDENRSDKFEVIKTAKFINKRNYFEDGFQELVKNQSYREFELRKKNLKLLKRIESYKEGKVLIGEIKIMCEKCRNYFKVPILEREKSFVMESGHLQICKCGYRNNFNLTIDK